MSSNVRNSLKDLSERLIVYKNVVSKDDACLHFYWKTRRDTGEFWVVVTPTNFGCQRSCVKSLTLSFYVYGCLGQETTSAEISPLGK